MSNYKRTYATVEEQELRRLREAERQLRAIESNMPDLLDAAQQANRREIERAYNSMLERQQASQRQIQDRIQALQAADHSMSQQQQEIRQRVAQVLTQVYESERQTEQRIRQQRQEVLAQMDQTASQLRQETGGLVSDLRQETHGLMSQQRQELVGRIERTAGQLRQETRQLITEQDQRLRAAIEQERQARAAAINKLHAALVQEQQERIAQIRDLRDRLSTLEQEKVVQRELASALIKEAEQEKRVIEHTQRPQLFAPGELAKLDQVLQNARADLQGAPQTALANAERAYEGMVDLRRQLATLEAAWELAYAQAVVACDEVLETAARNRQCKALGLDAEGTPTPLEILIEVDHWTQGGLAELEQEARKQRESLGRATCSLTTQELEDVSRKAGDWRTRLEELIAQARLAAIGAQERNDIAEIAVEALVDQGFEFVGDAYEGSDDRRTFQANVADRAGNQIVVRVSPVEGRPLDSQVELISYDTEPMQRTPVELRARARDVANVLRDRGVPVPEMEQVLGAVPNPAWTDLERVKRAQAATEPAKARKTQTG